MQTKKIISIILMYSCMSFRLSPKFVKSSPNVKIAYSGSLSFKYVSIFPNP